MECPKCKKIITEITPICECGYCFNDVITQTLSKPLLINDSVLKLIAIIEIYGGGFGILSSLFLSFLPLILNKYVESTNQTSEDKTIFALFIIITFILYSISFLSGYLLYKRKFTGLVLSIIIQIFQMIQFKINNIYYVFISGFSLEVFNQNNWSGYNLHFGPRSFFDYKTNSIPDFLSFNIISILIFIYLLYSFFKNFNYKRSLVK